MAEFARSLSSHAMQAKVRHTMRLAPVFQLHQDMPDEIAYRLAELDRVTQISDHARPPAKRGGDFTR